MAKNKITMPSAFSDKASTGNQSLKKVPFAVSEAYKGIRANLISMLKKDNKKVIIISSPNAGEGKSTTSINIAISLSQLNKKVLLIDVDAHRPTIHQKLKISNSDGIMNVIAGFTTIENAIQHHNSMLDIITVGPVPLNPTEAFSDPAFEELLKGLREEYDYIILDAPPVNLLSDSLVMAQYCDGMILIIRSGNTTHESMRRALSSLEVLNINILGVILNGTNVGAKKYYSSYGY